MINYDKIGYSVKTPENTYYYGLPMTYVEFLRLREDYKRGYLIKLTETLDMKTTIIAKMFFEDNALIRRLLKRFDIKPIDHNCKQSDSVKEKQIRFLSQDKYHRYNSLIEEIEKSKSIYKKSKNISSSNINGMELSYLFKVKNVRCMGDVIAKLIEYNDIDLPDKLIIEVSKK